MVWVRKFYRTWLGIINSMKKRKYFRNLGNNTKTSLNLPADVRYWRFQPFKWKDLSLMTSYKVIKLFKSKGFEFSGITLAVFKKYKKEFLKNPFCFIFDAEFTLFLFGCQIFKAINK